MSRVTAYDLLMKSGYTLVALLLLASAMIPASAQVAHEDPGKAVPGQSVGIDEEVSTLLGNALKYMNNASASVLDQNFTAARRFYYQFSWQYDELNRTIWQLNGSDPGYDAIARSLNATNDGLAAMIDNADNYNLTRQRCDEAVLAGDIANVTLSRILVRDRYTRIAASYDAIKSNASDLSSLLQNKSIDDRRLQSAMKNFDDYVNWLKEDYDRLGIEANHSIIYCGANQTAVSVGSMVKITVLLVDDQKNPINDAAVNLYVNNRPIGSNTTGDQGTGSIVYTVPTNIDTDVLLVQAGYTPPGGSQPGVFSSPVVLHVTDIDPSLSMEMDGSDISYGDTVTISGRLSNVFGVPVGGKSIVISIDSTPIGTTVTDDNGSYVYDLSLTPYMPMGNILAHAAYMRKTNDIFQNGYSDARVLNVIARDTDLTLNVPRVANLGDRAWFNGTLITKNGKPVSGANVSLYMDGVLSVNGTSDDNGLYAIALDIPGDAVPGVHTVSATFDPGYGKVLSGSSSGQLELLFNDTGRQVELNGLPLVIFKDDGLNVTGTLHTGAGAPIANRTLSIIFSSYGTATAVTDGSGNFNVSYALMGSGLPGSFTLTISDTASSSLLFSKQMYLLPYDKSKALGVAVISLVIISGVFLVFRRRNRR